VKLIKHFDAFLRNNVNLSDTRIAKLDSRVEAVSNFLSAGSNDIADNFIELIPQGSYAQRTIINPVAANDEYDADVLLDMDEVDGWEAEDYVEELYKVFRATGSTYRDMVGRRTRCVVVNYAGDFHMDVVPFLTRHDQRFITNRSENRYELTNPEGFNEWLDEQNRLTSGRLVKVLRLLKYVRDFKNNFTVKSVILTILVGDRVSGAALLENPDRYKDVPTALLNLLKDLNEYLQANPTMPSIDDPSCPSESFNHRWDQAQYANFRNWIATYTEWAQDAFDETDAAESYTKWRKLFGDKFGTYDTNAAKVSESHRGVAGVSDTEEFIENKFVVAIDPIYRVKLRARTVRRDGWRTFTLSRHGNRVARHRQISFTIASSNVPEPYDLWWKVRNTGPEAIAANEIRGQIVKDGGGRTRTEPTSYRGSHYVEVYVVKNGVVVAKDHQRVIIT
jgi:hypothetical protein